MRRGALVVLGVALAVSSAQTGTADVPPEVARSVPARPELAYAIPTQDPSGLAGLDAEMGRAMFERLWVAAPASTKAADGLGPLYNGRSCSACHMHNGRTHPPEGDGAAPPGLVARLAQPDGGPDPMLGQQVQPLATSGLPGEAWVGVVWDHFTETLPDGTEIALRRPTAQLQAYAWGAIDPATLVSLRAAPSLVGLGLISAIDPVDILAGSDPDDRDGDGIAGRARMVVPMSGGDPVPGMFGRRAGMASIADATALALSLDMGLSTPHLPAPWGDCTELQPRCRTAPHGDSDVRVHEVSAQTVDLIAGHLASLSLPAPAKPVDTWGAELFHSAGCASCHRPSFVIVTPDGLREVRPHSDFLLHDLGADLADPAPQHGIAPGEWRTAPLWGIGHARAVGNGRESWLHDGRARSLTEAILWHGGTAQPARDHFAALRSDDRAALIRYLEGL